MQHSILRSQGRSYNELRPITISYDHYGYAAASVLFELGNTKVHCAVNLQPGVPPFLKGKRSGWLKAEYAMLPSATAVRTNREASSMERNGRSIEISRLIGRVLRSVVNLDLLGEQTIIIDCDVLQADGGTRTACITGAFLALSIAIERWIKAGKLSHTILTDEIAAISIGVVHNQVLLDLDFVEDSSIDADFNVVLTKSGSIIEIQGTAEKKPVPWHLFQEIYTVAQQGITQLFTACAGKHTQVALPPRTAILEKEQAPLFSLKNRLTK
ncbi:MAG: ribonuclease PH [Candidatus Babeliales bacterium]